jgi:hypothetical protein
MRTGWHTPTNLCLELSSASPPSQRHHHQLFHPPAPRIPSWQVPRRRLQPHFLPRARRADPRRVHERPRGPHPRHPRPLGRHGLPPAHRRCAAPQTPLRVAPPLVLPKPATPPRTAPPSGIPEAAAANRARWSCAGGGKGATRIRRETARPLASARSRPAAAPPRVTGAGGAGASDGERAAGAAAAWARVRALRQRFCWPTAEEAAAAAAADAEADGDAVGERRRGGAG